MANNGEELSKLTDTVCEILKLRALIISAMAEDAGLDPNFQYYANLFENDTDRARERWNHLPEIVASDFSWFAIDIISRSNIVVTDIINSLPDSPALEHVKELLPGYRENISVQLVLLETISVYRYLIPFSNNLEQLEYLEQLIDQAIHNKPWISSHESTENFRTDDFRHLLNTRLDLLDMTLWLRQQIVIQYPEGSDVLDGLNDVAQLIFGPDFAARVVLESSISTSYQLSNKPNTKPDPRPVVKVPTPLPFSSLVTSGELGLTYKVAEHLRTLLANEDANLVNEAIERSLTPAIEFTPDLRQHPFVELSSIVQQIERSVREIPVNLSLWLATLSGDIATEETSPVTPSLENDYKYFVLEQIGLLEPRTIEQKTRNICLIMASSGYLFERVCAEHGIDNSWSPARVAPAIKTGAIHHGATEETKHNWAMGAVTDFRTDLREALQDFAQESVRSVRGPKATIHALINEFNDLGNQLWPYPDNETPIWQPMTITSPQTGRSQNL